jgi:aspartyl protease family protein
MTHSLPVCALLGLAAAAIAMPAAARADGPILLMSMTELKANSGGHFVTKASINGSDILALVDTGATTVALSYEDAEEAGLRPASLDFDVPVSTANGLTKAARVKIDRIEIDGISVDDVEAMVLPEGALDGTLLGMTFLGRLSSFKVEEGILYLRD